jgi:hypothetical protein
VILLTNHIRNQAAEKAIPISAIHEVLANPGLTYGSFERVDGKRQPRCCRIHGVQQEKWTGEVEGLKLCLVVNTCCQQAITVWLDQVETPIRPDQAAKGIVGYKNRKGEWRQG